MSDHIKNIYADGELLPEATVRKIRTVQQEGERKVSRDSVVAKFTTTAAGDSCGAEIEGGSR